MSNQKTPICVLGTLACFAIASSTETANISFRDVAKQSGVDFVHAASRTDQKYLPETMGSGVAIVDVDGDGREDLYFVNGAELPSATKTLARYNNRLYRNLGDWKFQDVTSGWNMAGQGYGMGVAVGDYNNDGKPDLYVTALGRNFLYRNTGTRFIETATSAGVEAAGWSAGAAFLDYNRDGHLDLFVARYLNWDLAKSRWCGEGEGSPRSYCHPRFFGRVSHILFRNRGDGTFEDVTATTGIGASPGKGLGVMVEDANDDGWPDIFVANDSVAQQLFLNRGGRRFDEAALRRGLAFDENGDAYAGMGIDVADVDGDARPDVFINALARQGYWLYRQKEPGEWTVASAPSGLRAITDMHSGWGTRFADFDHDGWLDLVVAQGHVMDTIEWSDPAVRYLEPPLLAKNVFGRFFDISSSAGPAFSIPGAGRGLAVGDLDNDGLVDLVISNNDGPAVVLRNTTAATNGWLAVELRGASRSPDGARVYVTTESGRRLRAYAGTGGSYLSASSPILHFGLAMDNATAVEVLWPSGARSTVTGSWRNRRIPISEPPRSAE